MDLVTKFQPYTDELFAGESKRALLTNQDFDWTGAHTVKVYKVNSSPMNDYGRNGPESGSFSCYGPLAELTAATEEFTLKKDRSFIFSVDKLNMDETQGQVAAASALARQEREQVIPEVDAYTYSVMCQNAGTRPAAMALTAANIYDEILKASAVLDNAEAPETGRVLVVTPETYQLLKKSPDIVMETDIGADMRLRGVIGMIDGLAVQKVAANRLPKDFGFLVAHPCATVAPVKLEDYQVHNDTIYNSGSVVTGRICYDAFVLENKKLALYYQASGSTGTQAG